MGSPSQVGLCQDPGEMLNIDCWMLMLSICFIIMAWSELFRHLAALWHPLGAIPQTSPCATEQGGTARLGRDRAVLAPTHLCQQGALCQMQGWQRQGTECGGFVRPQSWPHVQKRKKTYSTSSLGSQCGDSIAPVHGLVCCSCSGAKEKPLSLRELLPQQPVVELYTNFNLTRTG